MAWTFGGHLQRDNLPPEGAVTQLKTTRPACWPSPKANSASPLNARKGFCHCGGSSEKGCMRWWRNLRTKMWND